MATRIKYTLLFLLMMVACFILSYEFWKKQGFILLLNPYTEKECIHTIEDDGSNTVLFFKNRKNANRHNDNLGSIIQVDKSGNTKEIRYEVEPITFDDIQYFVKETGYSLKVVYWNSGVELDFSTEDISPNNICFY